MFRDMRRKKQALSDQECIDVLKRGEWGVLGVQGDDGYPYTVPLNYVFHEGSIFFHCAREGHKIDALKRSDKASFCVVDRSDLATSTFTTHYSSVIVFGRLRIIESQEERSRALVALVEALAGNESEDDKRAELDRCWMRNSLEMLELVPEHISGKQAKELVGKPDGQHPTTL